MVLLNQWLFEKSWPFLKAAWEGGGHGFGGGYELVENSSDITVLDEYDIETDDFWKCDSRHIYYVATSEPNISEPSLVNKWSGSQAVWLTKSACIISLAILKRAFFCSG